ncbi:putative g patch domain-containing protein 1 protein [Eutypa lata UCREL1]|uniref:Putative g patch domain-containing protein 1 protein n=1 Tax=Eutypa lata (strain UCR-EL1) TaxID=1287681 RepID=M7TCW2_EUTLA|nr:putative g patch domain-containing protein 1 protein [Eutypa lata UCREL1]
MSFKRSRATFEADHHHRAQQPQQQSYALYGTPLPPLDSEARDDGSYVPVWKQEVRDERGRKRLHGAFTGGFSAGYFNTVGSKEGWTPSTFVSSRSNRHNNNKTNDNNSKDGGVAPQDPRKQNQQRPEDFMDEEDLADAAERERLQTAQGFAGLGSTEEEGIRRGGGGGIADLFRVRGETMGVKLLKKMGWKEGQGIGPKIRRKARLDVGGGSGTVQDNGQTHFFAPDNVQMIAFVKKTDRKGVGYAGESRLASMRPGPKAEAGGSSDDEEDGEEGPLLLRRPNASFAKKKPKPARGGIGIGILNDTGSDDEDPYEVGPRISYNRVIGGDNNNNNKKKKIKPNIALSNPTLGSAPVFVSRKSALAKAGKNLRRCHDGPLPLDGFIFGTETDTLTTVINSAGKYPPPKIPEGWKSSKQQSQPQPQATTNTTTTETPFSSSYISTADAAKASKLDPKSRAALLGEAQLPGKSVFDFLSSTARDRLAAATGKTNLPPALGEVPAGHALSDAERKVQFWRQIPQLDKATALAALARGTGTGGGVGGGTGPYADNDAKRARYRGYLECTEDFLRELGEFHSCARIFRPITGVMASRFTTGTSSSNSSSLLPPDSRGGGGDSDNNLMSKPPPKPVDPAEEAASLGMYGSMTRSVADFYPSRLLCKRFGVRPPANAGMEQEGGGGGAGGGGAPSWYDSISGNNINSGSASSSGGFASAGAMTLDEMMRQAQAQAAASSAAAGGGGVEKKKNNDDTTREVGTDAGLQARLVDAASVPPTSQKVELVEVKPDVNEAVEGNRAQDDVLKAIFGDSSDEEDEEDEEEDE